MPAESLRSFYGYNRWATERLLETASRLTAEQLHQPGGAGHGSIHNTLLHLVSTQRGWVSWWNGSLSGQEAYNLKLEPADYPDLSALRRVWESVERDTAAFVDSLTEADLQRVYEQRLPNGADFRMPLWQMMLHVANHGTQHRSEVAALLTAAGHSPGDLDLLRYFWQPAA